MRETYLSLSGVVASEPRIVDLDDNRRITSFRLASTSRRKDPKTQQWVDGPTVWATVTCWRDLAFNASTSIHKKDRVLVHGRLRTRDWTSQEGVQRMTMEIDAESLGHDLAYGTSDFTRKVRATAVERPGRAEADELNNRVAEEAEADDFPALPALPVPAGIDGGSPDELDEELAELEAEEREEEAQLAGARA